MATMANSNFKDDDVSPNPYATYTHLDLSPAATCSKGGGTVWIQLEVDGEAIGQPSEFACSSNISALKKDTKKEYVELRDVSPACLEVWKDGVFLKANAAVPSGVTYDNPLKILAPPRKLPPPPNNATTTNTSVVAAGKKATAKTSHRTGKTSSYFGATTKDKSMPKTSLANGGILVLDPIKNALMDLLLSYLQKVQRAGCLQTVPANTLTPFQVLQAKHNSDQQLLSSLDVLQSLADWRLAYQQEGVAVLKAKLVHFQKQSRGSMSTLLPQDPKFQHLRFLVLGDSSTASNSPKRNTATSKDAGEQSKKRRTSKPPPTVAQVKIWTTTGSVHNPMPCRHKRRRCVVCKTDCAHECSHEHCQLQSKTLHDGRVLLGVPICPAGKKNCIDVHRQWERVQLEVSTKFDVGEEKQAEDYVAANNKENNNLSLEDNGNKANTGE